MRKTTLEIGLDLVEKILIEKIKTCRVQKKLTAMVSYKNALEMIRFAKNGNIEHLEQWLTECKENN